MSDMTKRTRRGAIALLGCVLGCVLGLAVVADAHHIRGIPHYAYSENYPTAPLFEELREVDQFSLRMSYYEIPGTKSVDFALYVKDRHTDKPYEGQVVYAVYGQNEDPVKAHSVTGYRNKNNIYKVGWTYEDPGVYWVRVRFGDAASGAVDEVFRLQMGDSSVNYWFLASAGGGVVLLILVVAVLKRFSAGEPDRPVEGEGV